jgi:hypothetical protein
MFPVAFAVSMIEPAMVAPFCGAVTDTDGGVVSVLVDKETVLLVVPRVATTMVQPISLASVVKLNVLLQTPAGTVTAEGR